MRGRLGVGLVVFCLFAARASRAFGDAAEVEALIAKANDLRTQGNPWRALSYYRKAFDLSHTPRTVGQLGFGELAAGYPVEAAEHLEAALRSPEHPWVTKYKDIIEETLTRARERIGELAIEGNVAGATVVIGGREVGRLPLPPGVRVAAGKVEVVVHAEGYDDFVSTIEVKGGSTTQIVASLVKKPVPPPPPAVVSETPNRASGAARPVVEVLPSVPASPNPPSEIKQPAPSGNSARIAGAVVGALGGAALLTAGALQFLGSRQSEDFNTTCGLSDRGPVLASTRQSDPGCSSQYETYLTETRASTISYVAGGVLAATSLVLLLWSYEGSSQPTGSRASLTCVPGAIGIGCRGTF